MKYWPFKSKGYLKLENRVHSLEANRPVHVVHVDRQPKPQTTDNLHCSLREGGPSPMPPRSEVVAGIREEREAFKNSFNN